PSGMFLLFGLLASLAIPGLSFNIDTKNAVIHNKANVKFGYSLDFYYEAEGVPILAVGAPEAETQNPQLRGIRKAGAVYACSLADPATCREIFADNDLGNEKRLNGSRMTTIEDKSKQFFGATVSASRKHDKLMMCAPQYKYFFTKFEVIEPVGACFFLETGAQKAVELSSCRQDNQKHGRHRLGYGQCGFSASVPDEGGRSFIGAPGMFYWQGGIFSQANLNFTDRLNTTYSPKEYDHNMMGYSVATGDFNGDGKEDAVAGAPRGDDLAGKLVLYTSSLKHILNLTDTTSAPQTGQYCGHSIAVTDLNNDGRDDIVTGCPFFTDYVTKVDKKTQERKPQYEVGKVLVYIQTAPGVFAKPVAIIGEEEWGRFGFSLAHAGDLNQDGYNDIVVGAPQGGRNKRGAVYILHGSKDGIREKPTQKIEGEDVSNQVRGFGFAVAGGVDVDANGMPDIAVGAVRSGSVLVMLSKPVVTVSGRTELDKNSVVVDEKNCDVDRKLGQQACRTIKTCLKYDGKGDTPNELEFTLTYNLDHLALAPRAHFIDKDIREDRTLKASSQSKTSDHPNVIERTVRLNKRSEKCFNQRFFVSSTMRDRLSPIHYSVNYTYIGSKSGKLAGGKLEPALDTTVPLAFEGKLSIANNCGKDELCIPNLGVTAKADKEKFILGTKDNSLLLNVDINNRGEDAFESKLYVDIPQGFEFGGVVVPDGKTPPSCSPTSDKPDEEGQWTWECDLGNPLPASKESKIGIRLTANEENPPTKEITVAARVNSTNSENDGEERDNFFSMTIPVDYDNSLGLIGQTTPEQIDFIANNQTKTERFDDRDIGPLVSHVYQVTNNGPSRMDVSLDIFWPSFSVEGNNLFYLITDPSLSNPDRGECRVKQINNVNPLNLRLTNEHVPTAPPAPVVDTHFDERPDEHEEGEDFDDEGATSGVQHQYEPVAVHEGEGGFEWTPNNQPVPTELEYIPDEEYEDDREPYNNKRVKRQQQQRRRPVKKGGDGRRRDGVPSAGGERARFADLKEAVIMSKAASGTVDYKGVLSRASVDCNSLRCTHIECDLHDIEKGEYVLVTMYARVDTETLVNERNPGGDVSSLAVARVINQKNRPEKQTVINAVTTHLNAIHTDGSGGEIPWWLYLLAILIGLLILALLILLLWRCGFFKRHRPPTAQAERLATNDPDARYADTKTRYAPKNDEETRAML
ncbi:hypothetical protein PMAYCL1PPCAC_12072, partial [Pristionchus mayeri]